MPHSPDLPTPPPLLLAAGAAPATPLAAHAQAGGEDIVIGGSIPMTGVFAFAGIGIDAGIKDYAKIVNDAGGIKGRKLGTARGHRLQGRRLGGRLQEDHQPEQGAPVLRRLHRFRQDHQPRAGPHGRDHDGRGLALPPSSTTKKYSPTSS